MASFFSFTPKLDFGIRCQHGQRIRSTAIVVGIEELGLAQDGRAGRRVQAVLHDEANVAAPIEQERGRRAVAEVSAARVLRAVDGQGLEDLALGVSLEFHPGLDHYGVRKTLDLRVLLQHNLDRVPQ